MARARPLPCAGAFRTGPGEESGTSAAPHSGAPRVGLHSSRSHSQCSAPAGSPWGPGRPQAWHLEVRGLLPHVRGMGTLSPSFRDSSLRPEPAALVSAGHTSQASSTHSQPSKGVSAEPLPRISRETGLSAALSHVGPGLRDTSSVGSKTGTKISKAQVEPLSITSHPSLQPGAEAEPGDRG